MSNQMAYSLKAAQVLYTLTAKHLTKRCLLGLYDEATDVLHEIKL